MYSMSAFLRICGGKTSSDWSMIGTAGVPSIWSDIFPFLFVFRVITVIFVLFVDLRVDGENLLRCAERTYVTLDHLVLEGCAYVLEVHYHSFIFT